VIAPPEFLRAQGTKYGYNVSSFKTFVESRSSIYVALATMLFSLLHIPDKALFIPLGMSRTRLIPSLIGTFAGKVLAYLLAIEFGDVFGVRYLRHYLSNLWLFTALSIALTVASIAVTMFVNFEKVERAARTILRYSKSLGESRNK